MTYPNKPKGDRTNIQLHQVANNIYVTAGKSRNSESSDRKMIKAMLRNSKQEPAQ